ncbi:MAG TPA: trehalase-like protein [Leeuwenhoekiella sp.]|nr:trehalase-like protein [Leeuwenhoekiella sp.]
MTEDKIYKKIKKLFEKNMVNGYSKAADHMYHYTKPSPETYPFQFFWDTCLHVFILTAMGRKENVDMAKKHIKSLFALQKSDGFVGHMIYWNNVLPGRITDIFQSRPSLKFGLLRTHMSALIQPPLVSQAVLRIYEMSNDKNFLADMLPKLKTYYNYIAENRDFQGDGLISIISPFESGIDWKPSFDEVVGFKSGKANGKLFLKFITVDARNFFSGYNLKKIADHDYFMVKEVGFNTIYAQNLKTLSRLCEIMQDPDSEIYEQRVKKCTASMLNVMYDDETAAFYDVYGKGDEPLKVLTPTIFFPLILEGIPKKLAKAILERHYFNADEFGVPFPIPSLAINSSAFNPKESLYIWRGPTWTLFNWFLYPYFLKKGYKDEAERLMDSMYRLVQKSGFREYYDPFSGKGHGAKDFTWPGLIIDMIKQKNNFNKESGP